jgi:5-methylthioadenosine/S-adenosylhomocysteine deaminase
VLDVDKPKFTPLTNVPARVVNSAAPADVETVVVDGDVLLDGGEVLTIDPEAVTERVETAVDRFETATDWDLGLGGSDPPGSVRIARDIPKRGPAQLLGRIAVQSAQDALPFWRHPSNTRREYSCRWSLDVNAWQTTAPSRIRSRSRSS